MSDELKKRLLDACELLIDQYEANSEFVMGGFLTNKPFLQIADVLKELGIEPKKRELYEVKDDRTSFPDLILSTCEAAAIALSKKDKETATAKLIF